MRTATRRQQRVLHVPEARRVQRSRPPAPLVDRPARPRALSGVADTAPVSGAASDELPRLSASDQRATILACSLAGCLLVLAIFALWLVAPPA
jgi:hypothetical protein